ncbi:MAG: protoheme IX farnesyltransferase [Acidobacteria bacterium 37-71-11]|nr:MAG: protoheme IX farnesyltransferase [Acidobacteria bacterium 37-71-11]
MRNDVPTGARTNGGGARRALAVVRAYPELTKIRLTGLVVATTAVGFLMAGGGRQEVSRLAWTVLGTALAAAGAMALNQVMEVGRDARMERTRRRPLPAGVLTARHALAFGVVVAGAGLAILAAEANTLTAVLGLTVVLVYTLVYTPLKPRSPLCTLAGAVCGAIPPMMGWTATGTPLGFGAWLLAGVLFLWQIPHFLALAWLYRDDYARGGFRMLSVVDASGRSTGQAAVLYSMALLPVGVLAALGGMTGWGFAAGSLVLTGGLVALALALAAKKSDAVARRLFLATLIYLPLLLGLMVADRLPSPQGLAAALQAAGR